MSKISQSLQSSVLALALGFGASAAQAELAVENDNSVSSTEFTPHAQPVNQALWAAAQAEQGAALKKLEQLVNIETGTKDPIGIPQMSQLLAKELKKLGADVTLHPAVDQIGNNVVGTFKGKGGGHILMMAHMDTVYPRGTLAKTPFKVENNKAYGPGIGDAKSGIAVILHSLALLKQMKFQDYGTITVLFNTDEEKGSHGSKDLIQTLAKQSDYVLSYEPTMAKPEVLTLNTSGIGAITASFTGKAAHAGANPELGANALIEASDFALKTMDLDQGPGKMRFNWTVMNAGEVANIVPDRATLRSDVRYPSKDAFDQLSQTIQQRSLQPRNAQVKTQLDINPGRPPFNADQGSRDLIQRAVNIYAGLGHEIKVVPVTGGGTDAGYAMAAGKPIIEALGLPGFGFHANVGEWIVVDAIPRRLYLSAQLVMDLAKAKQQ